MSAITSDLTCMATEAPVAEALESGKVYRREEEFRFVLNKYMAGYVADQQKRHAAATGSTDSAAGNGYFTVFRNLPGWIGTGRHWRLAFESPFARQFRDKAAKRVTQRCSGQDRRWGN